MNTEYKIAVILSAGVGKRMNSSIPKQYLMINEKPILYYTILPFETSDLIDEIILVAGENDIEYCREEIVKPFAFQKVRKIVAGGKERYHSVYNALRAVEKTDVCTYILIHDGARPVISQAVIERNINSAREYGNGCTGVPVKDTIKMCDEAGCVVETIPRTSLWQIQTPQTFEYQLIKDAYDTVFNSNKLAGVTDDAMIIEKTGLAKVHMVMGEYSNIKVTTPDDLPIVSVYLNRLYS